MSDLTWQSLTLVERPGRPADSPIWDYDDGEIRVLHGANLALQPPRHTSVVHVPGCPGVAEEGPNHSAALAQAFGGYATRANTGPRVRDITDEDRAVVAAILGSPAPAGMRGR